MWHLVCYMSLHCTSRSNRIFSGFIVCIFRGVKNYGPGGWGPLNAGGPLCTVQPAQPIATPLRSICSLMMLTNCLTHSTVLVFVSLSGQAVTGRFRDGNLDLVTLHLGCQENDHSHVDYYIPSTAVKSGFTPTDDVSVATWSQRWRHDLGGRRALAQHYSCWRRWSCWIALPPLCGLWTRPKAPRRWSDQWPSDEWPGCLEISWLELCFRFIVSRLWKPPTPASVERYCTSHARFYNSILLRSVF